MNPILKALHWPTPQGQLDASLSRKKRRGFTAIEFTTSIAIIFLVLILMIPAVFRARNSARSAQCQNILKQLSLALHNYHDAHQTFPPGYISIMGVRDLQLENEWGWGAFLLPYLEQAPLSQQINFSTSVLNYQFDALGNRLLTPVVHPGNSAIAATFLNSFGCPADQKETLARNAPGIPTRINYAPTTYSGVTGIEWESLPCATLGKLSPNGELEVTGVPCSPAEGVFFLNSHVRIVDLRDGLSQTMFLGETSSRFDTPQLPPNAPVLDKNQRWGGSFWAGVSTPLAQDQVLTATIEGVNSPDENGFSSGLNSFHHGGVHVALADGSVRFLSENIDSSDTAPYGVLQHLSTTHAADISTGF